VGKGQHAAQAPAGILTGMGAGFLIALGALSALPEACSRSASVLLAVGVALGTFVIVLIAHRAGHERAHTHGDHRAHSELSLHDARLAVGGLALHSLLDGVAVSGALASERTLGIFVAVFIVLHKLPEGAAAAAITYASGGDQQSARRGVFCLALASALGALTIFAVGPVLAIALSVAAGVTSAVGVGIATHLLQQQAGRALLGIAAGALAFLVSDVLLHA
jgi:zinc transporter ZupT